MFRCLAVLSVFFLLGAPAVALASPASASKDWSFNATIIEACSCPMFCQCFFNAKPASHAGHEGHGEEHFCKANNAFKVNKGMYGDVKLDGARFWFSGDLGGDFSKMEADWGVITFDPSVTAEQREGIKAVISTVYPFKWKSFTIGQDASIEWTATKDRAVAKLDGGKAGEVVLARAQGMTDEPIVIRNLKYMGAARNDGFILMPNEIEAYRLGDKPYEFKGTNGFMITIDTTSKDVQGGAPAKQ
jgi:hypothetical protein